MRRILALAMTALTAVLLYAPAAHAAIPSLGSVSATNIQGISATLTGTVDPEGLATTYFFEYGTQASFAGAAKTTATDAGADSSPGPARAALAGLQPDTTYHYRLVATNLSGTTTGTGATFKTTHGFGFLPGTEGFDARVLEEGGGAATDAGSRPYQLDLDIGLNEGGEFEGQPGVVFPDGDLRDLHIELPAGMIMNPAATPKCTVLAFNTPRVPEFPKQTTRSGESCPDSTQVGVAEVHTSLEGGKARRFGVYNLEPPPGVTAQIALSPYETPIILDTNLRTGPDGSYRMTLDASNVPQSLDLHGLDLTLWGIPTVTSHDIERGNCLNETEPGFPWGKCDAGGEVGPAYLSMPHKCSGTLAFSAEATSWQQATKATASAINREPGTGVPAEMGSCTGFKFETNAEGILSDTKASSPAGYQFRLTVGLQTLLNPFQRAPVPAKLVTVQLPEGATVNPSVGAGLGVCTPSQYAAETPFSKQGDACPNTSKIGDFTVRTPFFPTEELLNGAIYLAQSDDPLTATPGAENPFDSLVAVYLVAKLPNRGILVKVAGRIDANESTGRLTATFDGLPQLPYTDLSLTFRSGQRSFLVTPPSCGTATSVVDLLPWAGPLSVHATTDSQILSGIGGGPCPSGAPPFQPGVNAGGVNSNVNAYTPYFVHISRKDDEQELTSYSLVLPKGITGKLAGIPFCPEAAIAAARVNRGTLETANPSCPKASEVGHTLSGYGVGNALTYATGRIFLAGPYNGQPLSLVAVNSATVGPFDLGTIVIRSAFAVDRHTAQLQIDRGASDPIPHILQGIPIHLRDIRIYMDRYQFTHNPSSCAPSELVSNLTGSGATFENPADDSTATATQHFQLLNCLTLGFKPKLGVRLRGGTKRGAYPELRATFAARGPGDSNLKEIAVSLPHSQFLAQEHIKSICTNVQFNAGRCPADSVYGSAVAYTPLFDAPLRGKVYLKSSKNKLPDLVASLYSGAINIVLEGKIGPTKQGGIRALFSELPDEPLDRFVMTLYGGKRGLLVNSSNICVEPPVATVRALAQNNLGSQFTATLRGQCKGKGKDKDKGKGKGKGKKRGVGR
jgi:hypothetical protein